MPFLLQMKSTASSTLLKFLGMNLPLFLWVTDMVHCPHCERKLPKDIERCPTCDAPLSTLIKDPEEHGFRYLVVNSFEIPNDC